MMEVIENDYSSYSINHLQSLGYTWALACTLLPLLSLTGSAQNGSLSAPLNILSLKKEKQKVSVQRDSLSTSLCNFSNLGNLRSRPFKVHTRPLTKSLLRYHSASSCVAPCCLKANTHTEKICLQILKLTHSMECTVLETGSGNSAPSFSTVYSLSITVLQVVNRTALKEH